MAQQLRAVAAVPEVQGSVPRTHTGHLKLPETPVKGDLGASGLQVGAHSAPSPTQRRAHTHLG